MNILVINIALRPESPKKLFPIGLGYITTAMKQAGLTFDLLDIDGHRHSDQEVENFIQKKKYDVICMGCIVTGYKIVKALADLVKKHHPQAIIIAGNSVATTIVDTLLTKTKVDIAVISEGDETIVELLNTLSKSGSLEQVRGICFVNDGQVVLTPPRPMIKDISTLPFIDFGIFDVETYISTSKFVLGDSLPIPPKKREPCRSIPPGAVWRIAVSVTMFLRAIPTAIGAPNRSSPRSNRWSRRTR